MNQLRRKCRQCGAQRSLTEFYKNSRIFNNPRINKDRLMTVCKICTNERIKKYRTENKEKYAKYGREWNQKNKQKRRDITRRFHKSAKGIFITISKRGNCEIKKEDFLKWYDDQEKKCHYCGITESDSRLISNHPLNTRLNIDRKNPKIGYTIENMALSCGWCNRIKCEILNEDEMIFIGRKIINPKWKKLTQTEK